MATREQKLGEVRGFAEAGRYAATSVHTDDAVVQGRQCLGLWRKPTINVTDAPLHMTQASDWGALDGLAFRHHRDHSIWWAIALCNGIENPLRGVVAGQTLTVPSPPEATAALLAEMPGDDE